MLLVCAVYLETIEKTRAVYQEEAQVMLSQNNREKAQILLTKRKLVEREASVSTYHRYFLQRESWLTERQVFLLITDTSYKEEVG